MNSNGDSSQEIKRRLKLGWKGSNRRIGKVIKYHDVSLVIRAKIIHTLVFSLTMRKYPHMCGWESWTMRKGDGGKWIHLKYSVLGRTLWISWITARMKKGVLKQIKPEILLEAKMAKLKLFYFGHMRRQGSLEKIIQWKIEGSRKRGRPQMR